MSFVRYAAAVVVIAGCGAAQEQKKATDQPKPQEPVTSDNFRQNPLHRIPKAKLRVGTHVIDAYVADDPLERQEGLMFVTAAELKENDGMIFVFEKPEPQRFWMRNTIIPLDIAYLKPDGTIINILTMQPLEEKDYPSAAPAQYAVELNAGWFDNHKVKAGAKFDLSAIKNR